MRERVECALSAHCHSASALLAKMRVSGAAAPRATLDDSSELLRSRVFLLIVEGELGSCSSLKSIVVIGSSSCWRRERGCFVFFFAGLLSLLLRALQSSTALHDQSDCCCIDSCSLSRVWRARATLFFFRAPRFGCRAALLPLAIRAPFFSPSSLCRDGDSSGLFFSFFLFRRFGRPRPVLLPR